MNLTTRLLKSTLCCAFLATTCLLLPSASLAAEDQKVLVTVNDKPITSFDVEQRINLWKLVGGSRLTGDAARKKALNELIDDIAEIEEAKRFKQNATEKEIKERLDSVAKGLKTDNNGLKSKLKAQGISVAALQQYLAAQIAFNRLIRGKNKEDTSVSKEDVNRKLANYRAEIDGRVDVAVAKFENDPRRRAVTVYELLEINFPIDGGEAGITGELLQSRAIEANQYLQKFRGCKSAKAAAAGIFNVRIGKKLQADGDKLPGPLKAALAKTKVGSAIGPMRGKGGLQLLAFCGVRKLVPPKVKRPAVSYPTYAQVENLLQQEKLASIEQKYNGAWRKGLLIEFRDPAYGP